MKQKQEEEKARKSLFPCNLGTIRVIIPQSRLFLKSCFTHTDNLVLKKTARWIVWALVLQGKKGSPAAPQPSPKMSHRISSFICCSNFTNQRLGGGGQRGVLCNGQKPCFSVILFISLMGPQLSSLQENALQLFVPKCNLINSLQKHTGFRFFSETVTGRGRRKGRRG